MLPSAFHGSAPVPSRSSSLSGMLAGEGRSGSGTNDSDSDASEDYTSSNGDSSDDEENKNSSSSGATSTIRPFVGFQFGQNQRPTGFGFGSSSGLSQFSSSNQTNSFGAQPTPQNASSNGISATTFALPTKIIRKSNNNAFGTFARTPITLGQTAQTSSMGHSEPYACRQPTNNTRSAAENDGSSLLTPSSVVQPASVTEGEPSRTETQGIPAHAPSANQRPENDVPIDRLPATGENLLTDRVQNVQERLEAGPAEIHAEELSQYATIEATSTSNTPPNIMPSTSITMTDAENFYAFIASFDGHPGESVAPTLVNAPTNNSDSARASGSTLPPRFRRKSGDDSCTSSSSQSSHGDGDSPAGSYAPSGLQEGSETNENQTTQRKRRLKNDEQRRRGAFRVASSPSNPQTEGPFSTPPGKPINLSTAAEEITLPHFEYRESAGRRKQKLTPCEAQENSNPLITAAGSTVIASDSAGQVPVDGLDANHLIDNNVNGSAVADARHDITQENAAPPGQVSAEVFQAAGLPASNGLNGVPNNPPRFPGETPQYPAVTDTDTSMTNDFRLDPESAAVLAERTSKIENYLITLVIEDKRFMNAEPSLVELVLPLCPNEKREYWLDIIVLCQILQSGPSRIDGPAKAYSLRGRFRQYFLRVSAENIDNYGPGAIVVPYNRFLRVIVEPITSPMNQGAPGYSAQFLMSGPSAQLGSSFPSLSPTQQGLQMPIPVAASPQTHSSLKRGREPSPPRTATATSSSSGSATPADGQEADTSNDATPRKSYYRKRAL